MLQKYYTSNYIAQFVIIRYVQLKFLIVLK